MKRKGEVTALPLFFYCKGLTNTEGNARLGGVIGRHFHTDFVTYYKPDKAFAHFTRDMGQYFVSIRQFYLEHGSG